MAKIAKKLMFRFFIFFLFFGKKGMVGIRMTRLTRFDIWIFKIFDFWKSYGQNTNVFEKNTSLQSENYVGCVYVW